MLLDVLPSTGAQVVQDHHLVATPYERVNQVRADETSPSCDQGFHLTPPNPRAEPKPPYRSRPSLTLCAPASISGVLLITRCRVASLEPELRVVHVYKDVFPPSWAASRSRSGRFATPWPPRWPRAWSSARGGGARDPVCGSGNGGPGSRARAEAPVGAVGPQPPTLGSARAGRPGPRPHAESARRARRAPGAEGPADRGVLPADIDRQSRFARAYGYLWTHA